MDPLLRALRHWEREGNHRASTLPLMRLLVARIRTVENTVREMTGRTGTRPAATNGGQL
jgi:hypothetical protein